MAIKLLININFLKPTNPTFYAISVQSLSHAPLELNATAVDQNVMGVGDVT